MHLFAIIANLRFQDVLDILFLTIVAYHLYLWFRGTKAFKALIGLLGLGIVYTAARSWGLFLTTWVFQVLWQVLVILLIILFQREIRQVLERVNPLQALGLHRGSKPEEWIPAFAAGVFTLAKRGIGALVVLERSDLVQELVTEGQPIDGEPGTELLLSVFHKESPLHDGAALIRDGRITKVACYLPLSPDEGLPKEWGTRHRAALGVSERSDALVVVVSEERWEVSLARGDEVVPVNDPEQLSGLLSQSFAPVKPETASWQKKARDLFTLQWRMKVGTLALVSLVWLLLAGQQNFEVTLEVPLEMRNQPAGLEMMDPVNPQVKITVRGLRKDASTLDRNDVQITLDLSRAAPGSRTYRITRDRIVLPNDRLDVIHIAPAQIKCDFKQKS
jgi:uncharacterized protein (TIGR00159 family)